MVTNLTGLEFIDYTRELFEVQFFGDIQLVALGLFLFAMLLLVFIDAKKEAVLLVPVPLLIGFSSIMGRWWQLVVYLIATIYIIAIGKSFFDRG